jgi:hypothetical protein
VAARKRQLEETGAPTYWSAALGPRGFRFSRASDPLVPNYRTQNSKCFAWCRLGTWKPFFLVLNCTDVVPKLHAHIVKMRGAVPPAVWTFPELLFRARGSEGRPRLRLAARRALRRSAPCSLLDRSLHKQGRSERHQLLSPR